MRRLKSLLCEYDDGTQQRVDLDGLGTSLYLALLDAGLCDPLTDVSAAKNYMVLQWKDGWKEVVALDRDAVALIRYYVIRRIEDWGRLALDVGEGYPRLLIIERIPYDLNRILIAGESGVKCYDLSSEQELYEGTFTAGGKKEYLKYERSAPQFQDRYAEVKAGATDIDIAVSSALEDKGLTPEGLLLLERDRRLLEYEDIARRVGLRGAQRQSDVYGFIEFILKRLPPL